MAGETKAKKEEPKAEDVKSSHEDGKKPADNVAVSQPASDEPDAPTMARLREPFTLYQENMAHKLPAGNVMSSQNYDLEALVKAGAQLDVIELETGEVVADLNELLAE